VVDPPAASVNQNALLSLPQHAWSQARRRRPAYCADVEIGACHQSQDRQGAWPRGAADAARARRRGDRM